LFIGAKIDVLMLAVYGFVVWSKLKIIPSAQIKTPGINPGCVHMRKLLF
jgi:hypothetical protein